MTIDVEQSGSFRGHLDLMVVPDLVVERSRFLDGHDDDFLN
jgi:hypothetical protein